MDEKFRIAVGAGSSRGRQERSIDSAAMPSSSSPFSFGFPSQSSSSVLGHQHTTGSESSQPSLSSLSSAWRPSLYGLGVGLRPASDTLFGEAEIKASSGPSPFSAAANIVGRTSVSRFAPPDQRSAFDFSHGMSSAPAEASETWGQGLGLGNGQLFSSTSSFSFPPPSTMPSLQQSTTCPLPAFSSSLSSTATNAAFQAVAPKSSVRNGICNDAAGWRTIGSDTRYELRDTPFSLGGNGVPPSIEQKDVDTVFVFGASGGSGTGPRSGNFDSRAGNLDSKQPGVTSRSRFVRIKKHLNAIKGKVPTAVFRSGAGQPASEYSKASGFSGTGTDTGATQFCNTEFLSSLDINRASTADSFIGNNNQHRKSKQEPSHVPPWSKLQAASGYHSSWNHNLSSTGNDQHPSVHDSQAKALKGGKKETGETHSMHAFNQHFSFWNPFTQNRHEEVSDGTGQTSNQGVCFKSGGLGDLPKVDLVDSVSSEEHVADLIAGIANGKNPFGRQRPAGRFNPFVGDGGLNLATKSSGILDGGNFSQAEAAVKESHVSGSQDGQSDPCLDRINLSPAKQDDTYEALFQHFSKLGPFVASPDGCKENQEPKSINVSTKQSQEPLIFRASKSNPSAANAERVEPTTGFGGFNAPGIPLASSGSKHDNEVFENVNSDVLGGSKSTIINDFSDKLARSRSATPSILSSNSGVKFEAGCVNGVNDSPLSSVFSQPFVFSAGSGADSHISNASPVWSMPQDLRQFDTGGVHERVPVAEFAGPASSSESSGSGYLPSRVNEEQWTETEISSGASYSFMSWASNEGRNGVGISRRKKDKITRISSSNRRQRKQLYSKANVKSNGVGVPHVPVSENFDRGGSPMDFSPVFEAEPQASFPLGGSYNLPNVEQTSSFWGATMQSGDSEADYRDEREHLAEGDPRVEELRAAAANLSIGNEEGTYVRHTFDEGSQNSNGEHVSWSTSNFPSHRSGKWKRAALEEEKIAFVGFENAGLHAQREKYSENEVEFGDGSTADDGSIHQGQFKFTANFDPSSSSMMPRRRSRRIHREKAAGTIIDVGKTGVSRSDVESFPSMCPETSGTAGPGNKPGAMAAASAQAISNNFLLTFDVNTIEKVRTSGVFQADVSYSSADTVGQEKNVPAFPLQETNLLATDSLHRSETGVPASPRAVKAEQVCERWRLRGNQAYANGDFPKAEEYYSRGASSVSPNETSQSCIRASMLCYSNRAATRMAVGRMREALADCMRAIAVDPSFTRVRLRAASCHLSLGESKAAAAMFKECLKYANEGDKPDSKTAAEASDGMKRAQQLDDYSDRASELLGNDNTADATAALRLLNEALLISPNSERLLEMKAQAFLSLRRFEEVIQLCEQSLASAERNHVTVGSEPQQQVVHNSKSDAFVVSGSSSPLKLWRWRMTAKSLFHLGRLEDSLDLLTKHEEARATLGSDKISDIGSGSTEALASFIANIRDLLHHKAAGNEAFQTGKHAEAVEHYTAAMACNGESRPFIAVCFCNRAAASQALGHIADAIADCSRAIALDPNYPKAISRRATLHEMVRDYGQACHDLRRFLELLENHQQQGKSSHRGRVGNSNSNSPDLRHARDRIAKAEDEMKKGHPLDHYLILGVDPSCSANEIKKAYRKAALKHHPDKAGQFLVRGENGDDAGVWKEVGDDLRRDAERLFKMIGEAYAILSDPTKRLRYDTDEELRKLRTRGGSGPTSGMSEPYHYQYEKGGRRHRERWDSWTGYAHQYQRWQSGPDAAQPDTYARRGSYTSNGSKSSGDGSRNAEFDWDGL